MLTDLAAALRHAGLPVVERPGWMKRGHGPMQSVSSIVVHHTAGASSGEYPSITTVQNGRPGLDGPLAHILVGRSGTWYVVAAGLCYHAGATREAWQANSRSIGIEAEGTGKAAWPSVQMASLVEGTRVLADQYRVPYGRVLGHKEVCQPAGRKVDPNFSMPDFRSALTRATSFPIVRRGDTGPLVERIQRWLDVVPSTDPGFGTFGPKTEAEVRAYQEMRRIPVTGEFDAATWRETGMKP